MEPAPDVRYLWILRHAKAAPERTGGGRDRDRPLAERGRNDAVALGRRLATDRPPFGLTGLTPPGIALCSSAVRTVETAELVLGELEDRVPLDAYRSLYQADPEVVLTYVRELDEHARSVLVVGHNPTMYQLAWDLVAPTSPDRDVLEAEGFPPGALAVVALRAGGWEDVAAGCGTLLVVVSPPY